MRCILTQLDPTNDRVLSTLIIAQTPNAPFVAICAVGQSTRYGVIMRIFIGPNEIAGLASALQAGFHEIGVEADCILSHNHPFDYDCLSRSGLVVRVWQKIGVFRQEVARRSLVADRIAWTIWRSWSIIVWLWAITRFKNFIFIYGDTITNSVF